MNAQRTKPRDPAKPTCAVCGKPLGRNLPKGASKPARARLLAMLLEDPYDTAACARKAHGVDWGDSNLERAQTERAARELDENDWEAA